MTPERWRQVEELFHSAQGREPAGRAALLDAACGGDEALRREVESLLAAHDRDGSFLDSPAYEAADRRAGNQAPPLVGQGVNHYKVVSALGAGGMGEVYLAEDTRLGRRVALKFLPARFTAEGEPLRRFRQEARAASALNHPNILTIHEVGESAGRHYIATEFVEGETLRDRMGRGPLPTREALDVAAQIAGALSAAHEVGVVHRDVKPENVMLRRDRLVKVLDFGLAKLTQGGAAGPEATTRVQTTPGLVMGTPQYMSPEQARGLAVDARTDVFSLGCVLYEMVAGRAPFGGETTTDVLVSIVEREPPPLQSHRPEAPTELQRILTKALAKNPDERYQTAKDLAVDLKALSEELRLAAKLGRAGQPAPSGETAAGGGDAHPTQTAAAPPMHPTSSAEYVVTEIGRHKRGAALVAAALALALVGLVSYRLYRGGEAIDSLAVLPFVNAGGDPEVEYLSEGIAESLINSLSRLPNVKVMSRGAAFRYKGREADAQAVGRELGVRAVLTGRVVQRGEDLSISIELVDARDNSHVWGDQYNRKLSDLPAVQGEISRETAERLRVRLTGEEERQVARSHTENTEAYQLYLKGRFYLNKRTEDALQRAVGYFDQATQKDPAYALAYAGLADANMYLLRLGFQREPPQGAYLRAREAATKALGIDEKLAEAHTSLAIVKMEYEWDWAGAEREFKRAIELNPNSDEAHHQYSHYLTAVGRTRESLDESLHALELNPLSLNLNAHLGWHYLFARQYDQAIAQCRKTFEMDPNYPPAHEFIALAFEQKGMYAEAITEFQKARELSGDSSNLAADLGHAYAISGRSEEALNIVDELKGMSKQRYVSSYDMAIIYLGLGQKDQAFEWLEKAYGEHSESLRYLKSDPRHDSIRLDPRFSDLVRRVGLPR